MGTSTKAPAHAFMTSQSHGGASRAASYSLKRNLRSSLLIWASPKTAKCLSFPNEATAEYDSVVHVHLAVHFPIWSAIAELYSLLNLVILGNKVTSWWY
jgi:hypothetical protein